MSYTPTNWQTGDTITAEKLNNMESGIEASNGIIIPITVDTANERYYVPKEIAGDVYNQLVANPDAPVFFSFTSSSFATPFLISAAEKNESFIIDVYTVSFNPFLWATVYASFTQHPQNYIGATFAIAKSAYESGYDWAGGLISQAFVVTITPTAQDYSGTMDKTVGEINAAYEAGQQIVFRVLTSANSYVDVPMSYAGRDAAHQYPDFGAEIIQCSNNLMIVAYTGDTDDGTKQTYSTRIYSLTPMS